MFSELKFRKRCWSAYDKLIEPELKGYQSASNGNARPTSIAKRHISSALRIAVCMALVLTLVGVIVFQNAGGFATKTTPVQNDTSAQGGTTTKDSFTLTAYAASPSSVDSGALPAVNSIDQSTGTSMQSNVNITLPVGTVYKIVAGSNAGEQTPYYSSGFQFSGDNIALITMTTQDGSLTAENADVIPLFKKWWGYDVQEAKEHIGDIQKDPNYKVPQYQMTPEEQNLWNSDYKTGTTVTFSPSGFTVWWETGFSKANISDTINIAIKFNDGTIQNKTVTIGENDSGKLTATLS